MLDWLLHLLRPDSPPWWLPIATGFGGTLLGGAIGIGTRIYFEWRDAKRHRDAIYVELEDVQTAVATRFVGARQALIEFLTHRRITNVPSEIMFPIYERWFTEVALQFSASERVELNHIYQKIRRLNWEIREQRQHWDVFGDDEAQNETNLRKTVMLMESTFVNAGTVDHMIGMLLAAKEKVNAWDPERHASLHQREQYLDDELRKMKAAQA